MCVFSFNFISLFGFIYLYFYSSSLNLFVLLPQRPSQRPHLQAHLYRSTQQVQRQRKMSSLRHTCSGRRWHCYCTCTCTAKWECQKSRHTWHISKSVLSLLRLGKTRSKSDARYSDKQRSTRSSRSKRSNRVKQQVKVPRRSANY